MGKKNNHTKNYPYGNKFVNYFQITRRVYSVKFIVCEKNVNLKVSKRFKTFFIKNIRIEQLRYFYTAPIGPL